MKAKEEATIRKQIKLQEKINRRTKGQGSISRTDLEASSLFSSDGFRQQRKSNVVDSISIIDSSYDFQESIQSYNQTDFKSSKNGFSQVDKKYKEKF